MIWYMFVMNCIIGYVCSMILMKEIDIDKKYHNLIRGGIIITGVIWLPVVYWKLRNDHNL